jgi:hypothetical protein
VEALNLSVGLGPVGLGGEVLDPTGFQQLAQGAIADIGKSVVAHQPPGLDPLG